MTENLGSIRYDVEVGTAGMLKAESVVSKSTTNVANDFKKIDNAAKNTNIQMTKAAAGVRKGVQANLGQAGIQVQQFVGQLQGGQSAMVALAQQSADLGIVLGAPLIGVFVSLAAVLAGTLAPAIFGSTSNIEKLQKAIESTKAVMSIGASGVAEYTEEMKRLNTASETLAKIKIALAMTQNAEAMKAARKESSALRADLFGFQETAQDAAERLTGLTSKADDIQGIALAMRDFNSAASDDKKLKALKEAEELLLGLSKDGVFPTKELADYAQTFLTLSDSVRQTIANNKALKESQDDLAESNRVSEDSFNDMKNALLGNIIELKSGERAALKWSLLMQGLDADQQAQILRLYDKKEALEATNKATEEAIKANERYDESVRKQTESDLAWFEQQEQWLKDQSKQKAATLTTQVQSIGLTPLEQIQAQYDAEKALLEQAEADKVEIVGTYAERYAQIEAEKQDRIRSLQGETSQFMENAFGNLDTQIAGTLGNIVLGAQDGEEALKGLARTILTQVVGAIIQQGIASAIASSTAATAQTAANATVLSTAVPLAAATSLASFGANSGPALAGIAAVSAAAAALPSLMGGRQYGGPVSQGMYRVNETGTPEIYSQGGKDYLMNTKNANITPLDKAGGGSQMPQIIVNNNSPEKAYVTYDEAANIANVQIGREAKKASQGRGSLYNGLSKGTNVKNNARR
ncbi:MAG: putative tail tape measure protein [Prokaryotic dsDNA virus sp.]|nr:MAG: putative tail tape measure protein [Prokaryotic dsDNA virus sp.]|tara:strand:- start:32385 stop:34472 length:2088 start_codon:yes stop_codon:yes gene_type:complete